jgi:nicotinamide mononucleotide transporter
MSAVEVAATLFGLACVWLTIRRTIWCWPMGLVQVVLYVWIFYRAKLYSDVGLQVVYVVLQVYGWHHWLRGKGRDGGAGAGTVLPITRLTARAVAGWTAAAAAGTAALGTVMSRYTDAALPYWDAAITVLSLVAQVLLARKVLENWLFWIVVDVLAVGVYAAKKLYPTTGLYAVFLVMAIAGWLAWRKEFRRSLSATGTAPAPAPAPETAPVA